MAAMALTAAMALSACGSDGSGSGGGPGSTDLAGMVRSPALAVGDVELPDAAAGGEPAAMRAAEGDLLLVYFGYTFCPDICPTTMSDISVALADLPDDLAERVTVAMATVDPERDTGEVVAGYLEHFFDRSVALRTTDPEALADATDAFGVQFEVEEHAPGEAYDVAHSAVTYVVDDRGTVVVEWPFGFDSEAMTSDLKILLEEEHT